MTFVATVSFERPLEKLQGDYVGKYNEEKLLSVESVLCDLEFGLLDGVKDDVVYLLPGGFLSAGGEQANALFYDAGKRLGGLLSENSPCGKDSTIVFGADGLHIYGDIMGEQLAVAINRSGVTAVGRKFYPTKGEKKFLRPAPDYMAPELTRGRVFSAGGKKFYMGVCYDSFGIRRKNLPNPGVDAFLNLVHWFLPVGLGQSGETYYARHGFAGASKQWNVNTFGAAQFYGRKVPEKWPTGVSNREKPTHLWKYEDNALIPFGIQRIETPAGIALVKIYNMY